MDEEKKDLEGASSEEPAPKEEGGNEGKEEKEEEAEEECPGIASSLR